MTPRIIAQDVQYACPWFEVVAKDVELDPPRGRETFYSVKTRDYTAVLALTSDGYLPLVRQFRPAVEDFVLELPSGGIEPGEDLDAATRRELIEETGCAADVLLSLGCFHTDTGRMETRHSAYFAPDVRRERDPSSRDEGIELMFVSRTEVRKLIVDGLFKASIHLGILCACIARGYIEL